MISAARRLIRFREPCGVINYGLQEIENLHECTRIDGDIFGDFHNTEERISTSDLQLLAPVEPPIILGTGLNYRKHAAECGMDIPQLPFLAFFKQGGCVQHPDMPIRIPRVCPTPEVTPA